jgi:hypothetical protein
VMILLNPGKLIRNHNTKAEDGDFVVNYTT